MQILILYFSKGGNTRKLAEAIAEGIVSYLRHYEDMILAEGAGG